MDPDLGPTVGLGIICWRLFLGHGFYRLASDSHKIHALHDESLQRGLVVGLHDQATVAEPREVCHHQAGHKLIFFGAFTRH